MTQVKQLTLRPVRSDGKLDLCGYGVDNMRALEYLDVSGTKVSDCLLRDAARLPKLTTLVFTAGYVKPTDLQLFRKVRPTVEVRVVPHSEQVSELIE